MEPILTLLDIEEVAGEWSVTLTSPNAVIEESTIVYGTFQMGVDCNLTQEYILYICGQDFKK